MIRTVESISNKVQSPDNWSKSLWHTFITMLTVGYGDTTPLTYFGRLFSVSSGVFGYTYFSTLVITLNKILAFNREEENVKSFIGIRK